MKARQWRDGLLALVAVCVACDGAVDLGDRGPRESPVDDDASETPTDDPYWVKTERVTSLGQVTATGALAASGDFIYVAGTADGGKHGLYRCKRLDCLTTFERLPTIVDYLYSLQVHDGRLAVAAGFSSMFLASYALPDVNDPHVVIGDLPAFQQVSARFYRNAVYWPLESDAKYYRCALPTCGAGPFRMLQENGAGPISGDGDLVFFSMNGLILRIGALGDGPVERLLPDATLSVASPVTGSPGDSSGAPRDLATFLTTSAGMLYASVRHIDCQGPCLTSIFRWPVEGGAGEELVSADTEVGSLFVFDGELVWSERDSEHVGGAVLASCRIDNCGATRRHLGIVRFVPFARQDQIVFADKRLYWLGATRGDQDIYSITAIRSAPHLTAPRGG
ncbi:MAG TPA: hypothetical protein VHB79_08790 [Polyangiaceae bacterium]|nr:hypothetical protein [Polyangiaceae bacterium]